MKKKIMMTLMALSLSCIAMTTGTEEVKAAETGLKQVNGEWCYLTDGQVDKTKNGFVEYEGALFFVSYGKLVSEANGLMQDPINVSDWYYLAGGQAQTQYTGLAEYDGEWFYVEQGKLDTTMNAFVEYDGGLFFVGAGRIMDEVNGLAQDPQGENWYYLANGQVQTEYTGLAEYDGEWFYIESGKFIKWYEAVVDYNGTRFYVKNGQVIGTTEDVMLPVASQEQINNLQEKIDAFVETYHTGNQEGIKALAECVANNYSDEAREKVVMKHKEIFGFDVDYAWSVTAIPMAFFNNTNMGLLGQYTFDDYLSADSDTINSYLEVAQEDKEHMTTAGIMLLATMEYVENIANGNPKVLDIITYIEKKPIEGMNLCALAYGVLDISGETYFAYLIGDDNIVDIYPAGEKYFELGE